MCGNWELCQSPGTPCVLGSRALLPHIWGSICICFHLMLPDPVVLAQCYKTLVPYNMVFLRLWIFSFLSFFFWTPSTHPLTFVPDCTPVSVWRIHSALLGKDLVLWKCRHLLFPLVGDFQPLLRYSWSGFVIFMLSIRCSLQRLEGGL